MNTFVRSLTYTLAAAALLAGCGGGGSTTPADSATLNATGETSAAALNAVPASVALAATNTRMIDSAATVSAPDLDVVAITRISETRVSRTVYDYVFTLQVRNNLATPFGGGTVRLVSVGAGATIMDGEAALPAIAGSSVQRLDDTVTIRQDRTKPFDATALTWSITPSAPAAAFRGQFIDKPVEGLAWQTATRAGFTDATGHFDYDTPGETVWFSVGGLPLGGAAARERIHVSDLSASPQERWQGKNNRVAQLLQSLDEHAGGNASIRIPQALRTPTAPLQPVDFTLPQAAFETSVKALMSGAGLPPQNFVTLRDAAAHAAAFKQSTVGECPFDYPSYHPDQGFQGSPYALGRPVLTCQQLAALHYYLQRVKPRLDDALNEQRDRLGIIETTFHPDAVDEALDSSKAFVALNTVAEYVGRLADLEDDFAKKSKRTEAAIKMAAQSGKAMAELVSLVFSWHKVRPGLSGEQQALANLQSAKWADEVSSLFIEGTDCAAAMWGPSSSKSDSIKKCAVAISGIVKSIAATAELYEALQAQPSDEQIRAWVNVTASGLELLAAGAEAMERQGLQDMGRASLSAAAAGVNLLSNALKLAAIQNPGSGWASDGGQFLIGAMDRAVLPALEVASKCHRTGVDEISQLDMASCIMTTTSVMMKQTAVLILAVSGNVVTVLQSGKQAEIIVTRTMLEEYLWLGGDLAAMKARYGITGESQLDWLVLAAKIGERKVGVNPVLTYLDWLNIIKGSVWDGKNSFNVLDTASEVLDLIREIENGKPLDLRLKSIELAVAPSEDGQIKAVLTFDPAGLLGNSGLVECRATGSLNRGSAHPFRKFFDAKTTVSFDVRYAGAGQRLIICSAFSAGGAFVGSKTVAFESPAVMAGQLTVDPAPPSTYTFVNLSFSQVMKEFVRVIVSIGETIRDVALQVVDGATQTLTTLFETVGLKDIVAKFEDATGLTRATVTTSVMVSQGPTILSVEPLETPVVVGVPITYAVTGSNLPLGLFFQLEGCGPVTEVQIGSTDSRRQFTCTVAAGTQPGEKLGAIGPAGAAGTPFERALTQFRVMVQASAGVAPGDQAGASRLQDTGVASCTDYAFSPFSLSHSTGLDCALSTDAQGDPIPPRQDAAIGRDALAAKGQLTKQGAGPGGFDFTKLDAQGTALPASALQWACVRDNHTGLIWENKTSDGGLRDHRHRYAWYSTDPASNAGHPGSEGADTCGGSLGPQCNTRNYLEAVKAARLCGSDKWRIPKLEELRSIVNYGRVNPSLDTDWFSNLAFEPGAPGANAIGFWSSNLYSAGPELAVMALEFSFGTSMTVSRGSVQAVRAVTTAQ